MAGQIRMNLIQSTSFSPLGTTISILCSFFHKYIALVRGQQTYKKGIYSAMCKQHFKSIKVQKYKSEEENLLPSVHFHSLQCQLDGPASGSVNAVHLARV